MHNPAEIPTVIVTPGQLNDGYWTDDGMVGGIRHHAFRIVRQLPDGNYVVRQPESFAHA